MVSEEGAKGNARETKGNDESLKASPQCTEEASKDSLKGSGVEAPKADGVCVVGAVSVEMGSVESREEVKVASEEA